MSKQHWIIGQLSHLHKNVHLFQSDKLVKRILTYLTVQAYFEVDSSTSEYGVRMLRNEKVELELSESILEYVGVLMSKHETKFHSVLIDIVKGMNVFLETEKKNGKKKPPIEIKLSEKFQKRASDYKTLSERMAKLLGDIFASMQSIGEEKVKGSNGHHVQNGNLNSGSHFDSDTLNKDVLETFFIITSIECFRMFESFKNSQQAIEDVEICFEKFSNELSKMKSFFSKPFFKYSIKKRKQKKFKLF
jgi:hypothetical protein